MCAKEFTARVSSVNTFSMFSWGFHSETSRRERLLKRRQKLHSVRAHTVTDLKLYVKL